MQRWHWSTATGTTRLEHLAGALAGLFIGEVKASVLPAGRVAALAALRGYDLADYGKARNYLDAPISRLSAYLRHGLLTIQEVRDEIKIRYATEPNRSEEFLRQLAWRDFFEHVLDYHGEALNEDLEERKHGVSRVSELPSDIATATTDLPCMDGMLRELFDTGYLHNHERLWLAAYVCHYRGISWKAGAALFRQYLLDGDLASNSSSWQWVEGTFAAKPYFMNKENIAKFSDRRWCDTCAVRCPFDSDYDALNRKLFQGSRAPLQMVGKPREMPRPNAEQEPTHAIPEQEPRQTEDIVWLHDYALAPKNLPDGATLVFIIDEAKFRAEPWAFHRFAFVWDSVLELFATRATESCEVMFGDPAKCLSELTTKTGAKRIHIADHPTPEVRRTIRELQSRHEVVVLPRVPLATNTGEPRRFSRYWDKAAPQVLGYKPKSSGKKFHQ